MGGQQLGPGGEQGRTLLLHQLHGYNERQAGLACFWVFQLWLYELRAANLEKCREGQWCRIWGCKFWCFKSLLDTVFPPGWVCSGGSSVSCKCIFHADLRL